MTQHNPLNTEIFFMNEHIHHGVQDLKLKSRESLRLKFGLSGVMHSGESEILNFIIEYLRKIKTKFKNTFSFVSGAQKMGANYENKEVENLMTHSH